MYFTDNPVRHIYLIVFNYAIKLKESASIFITIFVHENLLCYNIYIKYSTYITQEFLFVNINIY